MPNTIYITNIEEKEELIRKSVFLFGNYIPLYTSLKTQASRMFRRLHKLSRLGETQQKLLYYDYIMNYR